MPKNRNKLQSIIFVSIMVGLVFGGFAFWIKSDEVESVAWGHILAWAGGGMLLAFAVYWLIAYIKDKPSGAK